MNIMTFILLDNSGDVGDAEEEVELPLVEGERRPGQRRLDLFDHVL